MNTDLPCKFVNLSERLNLRISNKHVALQNLPIYYTWKNIRNNTKTIKSKLSPHSGSAAYRRVNTNHKSRL